MEGYDNMDNNLNNGSGIPNVSDIKFEDTPAESFENIYGGQNQNNNVGANNVGGMNVNPAMNNVVVGQAPQMVSPSVNQAPVQSNIGVQSQATVEPQVSQPNVGVNVNPVNVNPVNVEPTVMPNNEPSPVTMDNNAQVAPNPQTVSNPGIVNPTPVNNVGVQPSVEPQVVQPNVGVNVNPVNTKPMNNGIGVNNSTAPNMNQEAVITPNPVNVTSNGAPVSSVNIDAERMQSIEEQLSKTSQYNPADFQQEQISIPTDNQSEKNKSGLAFVVGLFVLLGVVIALLPQITKMIK